MELFGLFFRKKASYKARNTVFNARFFFDKMCTFLWPNSRGREKIGNEQLRHFFYSPGVIKFIKFRSMKFSGIKYAQGR